MNKVIQIIFILSTLLLSSCGISYYVAKSHKDWEAKSPGDTANIVYTIFLVGDAGRPDMDKQEPTLKLLQSQMEADSNSAVVFLGDNIYHDGLPKATDPDRPEAERRIKGQLEIIDNYRGRPFFIGGNHDWNYQGMNGWPTLVRQEIFVENYLNRGNVFVPDFGCPGPYQFLLNKDILLIAIDSQWWLHMYDKPMDACAVEDKFDFVTQLEDILKRNKNKFVLVVAHHPLFSNGNHGGYFNVMDHIFPIRIVRKNAYIPLPLLGSLYPLHRKFGGTAQDMAHYMYQDYKNSMLEVLSKFNNVVYAAGHDHNLQYHRQRNLPHILSGAGCKLNYVSRGHGAIYTQQHKGFAKLNFYDNGELWVEYWIPKEDGTRGEISFKTKIYRRRPVEPELICSISALEYKDSTRTVKATERYEVSKFKRFLFGNHYREAWVTPVEVKVLDLKREKGGLIPYAKGGGKQSVSLKAKNMEDREYVMRSVNKDPIGVIPNNYHNTVVHDIVQDQISAQHPYGALVVPKLADAAEVLHTNPQLRVIPADSCLGPYFDEFKNMLVLFEEDPDENHEDVTSLGNSKNIIGTERVTEKIEEDNDNFIDQRSFLRARLLDMFIGDWDRHAGQFRWASFKTEKGEYFKAIPKDRDIVLFKFDGIVPSLAGSKWAIRNLENFEDDYGDLIGLNLSAKSIDRRFLTSLSRKDWQNIAKEMQENLTDEVIESAVKDLPQPVYQLHGAEIISKLKSRRKELPDAADKYYEILAKYVDIYGSNKHEKFLIERINNEQTKVTVYKVTKEGEVKQVIYERLFYGDETEEIRLYGLAGEDQFIVNGEVKKSIKLRIIGGDDKDSIIDNSSVKGLVKKTSVYDTEKDNSITSSDETSLELDNDDVVNYPGLDKFFYNYLGPQFDFFYNQDDGLFVGVGFLYRNYRFRKIPYGSQHRFLLSRAMRTGSVRIYYDGDFTKVLGGLDIGLHFDRWTPAFVMNFFGYGNDSKVIFDEDSDFHNVSLDYSESWISFNKRYKTWFKAGLGPKHNYYQLKELQGSLVDQTFGSEQNGLYRGKHYVGIRAFFNIGTQDKKANPTRGIIFSGEANLNQQVNREKEFYQQYRSEFKFYVTPNFPFQLTFAGRIGAALNFGKYEFYQANMLGGTQYMLGTPQNLRGYSKTRFIGDKSMYTNAEVRWQFLRFNAYIFPGKLGVLGFLDNGRVWVRNEVSDQWHTGYGAGLWIDIYDKLVLTSFYGIGEDENQYNVRLGFVF